jgi:ribosomal protein L5
MNPMKQIRIEKVTLNIGTGKPGPELEKAMKQTREYPHGELGRGSQ